MDAQTESAIRDILGCAAREKVLVEQEGDTPLEQWIDTKINAALTAAGVDADRWGEIKTAVISAMVAGKLGDGTASEDTSAAITSMIHELAAASAAPAPGPATPDDDEAPIDPGDIGAVPGVPPLSADEPEDGPVPEPDAAEEEPLDMDVEIELGDDGDDEGLPAGEEGGPGSEEEPEPPEEEPEEKGDGEGPDDFEDIVAELDRIASDEVDIGDPGDLGGEDEEEEEEEEPAKDEKRDKGKDDYDYEEESILRERPMVVRDVDEILQDLAQEALDGDEDAKRVLLRVWNEPWERIEVKLLDPDRWETWWEGGVRRVASMSESGLVEADQEEPEVRLFPIGRIVLVRYGGKLTPGEVSDQVGERVWVRLEEGVVEPFRAAEVDFADADREIIERALRGEDPEGLIADAVKKEMME